MIVAVLWDFDGVVVLTPHEKAWRLACEKYRIEGFTSEFYHEYVSGRPRYEGARAILQAFGVLRGLSEEERERLVLEFGDLKNRLYWELLERGEYVVNEEVVDFIEKTRRITGHSFRHVLASASKNVSRLASTVRVRGKVLSLFFNFDVSGSGSTKSEVFRNGLRAAGEFDCAVAIDDAPSGIRAALEAGVIPVGYKDKRLLGYGARLVIESFRFVDPEVMLGLCGSR